MVIIQVRYRVCINRAGYIIYIYIYAHIYIWKRISSDRPQFLLLNVCVRLCMHHVSMRMHSLVRIENIHVRTHTVQHAVARHTRTKRQCNCYVVFKKKLTNVLQKSFCVRYNFNDTRLVYYIQPNELFKNVLWFLIDFYFHVWKIDIIRKKLELNTLSASFFLYLRQDYFLFCEMDYLEGFISDVEGKDRMY